MAVSEIRIERSARKITPAARVSYPALFKPQAFNDTVEPKYGITLMISKETGAGFIEELKKLQDEALTKLYPIKKPANIDRYGITDGDDTVDKNGKPIATNAGYWLVKASNKTQPRVVDASKEEILDADAIYGGMWAKASIQAKAYGTPQKGGVVFELLVVQKIRDDTPFGGAAARKQAALDELSDETEM